MTKKLHMSLIALMLSPLMLFSQVPIPVDPGQPVPVDTGQPIPVLSPYQLQGLVAPIALYPDPLVSQILVAATYPLQVVEAYQWLQRNPGLNGPALTQGAQAQNWDPSIQALVMFPDILMRLNEDIAWTTNLGNAFMYQQADVMGAIQQMRQSAEQSGRLVSTPQQQVINTLNAGQPVVEIVPANPEVIYVPVYDPAWVWGPAVYYPYPRWHYPAYRSGLFFNVGISIGRFVGHGWGGWGGWGWHPAWGRRTVVVNNTFIQRYNFNTRHVVNVAGASRWPRETYRGPVTPYVPRASNEQFRGNFRQEFRSNGGPIRVQPRADAFAQPQARALPPPRAQVFVAPRPEAFNAQPSVTPNPRAFAPSQNGHMGRFHENGGYSGNGFARSNGPAFRSAQPAPRAEHGDSRGSGHRGRGRTE